MKMHNAEIIRAVLRAAERRLSETLKDLESNDLDDSAMTHRLEEIARSLRLTAIAA